jgi:uncharacterized protein YaiI (UPF0178 family)
MVEKILRRSRDPGRSLEKPPQTPKHMRGHGQLYIHTNIHKHLLLKSLPARKQSRKQDNDLQCKAQQGYQDRFIEAIAREVAHKWQEHW